jgi:antitoxin VapB
VREFVEGAVARADGAGIMAAALILLSSSISIPYRKRAICHELVAILRLSPYLADERTRHAMPEPQLSIRRSKARDLAHALSRRTGQPINRLVQLALERDDRALREDKIRYPMEAVWDLAAEDRRNIPPGTTSAHNEFYDENGLPL